MYLYSIDGLRSILVSLGIRSKLKKGWLAIMVFLSLGGEPFRVVSSSLFMSNSETLIEPPSALSSLLK